MIHPPLGMYYPQQAQSPEYKIASPNIEILVYNFFIRTLVRQVNVHLISDT